MEEEEQRWGVKVPLFPECISPHGDMYMDGLVQDTPRNKRGVGPNGEERGGG